MLSLHSSWGQRRSSPQQQLGSMHLQEVWVEMQKRRYQSVYSIVLED